MALGGGVVVVVVVVVYSVGLVGGGGGGCGGLVVYSQLIMLYSPNLARGIRLEDQCYLLLYQHNFYPK